MKFLLHCSRVLSESRGFVTQICGSEPHCADQNGTSAVRFTAFWKGKNGIINTAKLIYYFSCRQLTSVMHYNRLKA
jgi:hypothetical protein